MTTPGPLAQQRAEPEVPLSGIEVPVSRFRMICYLAEHRTSHIIEIDTHEGLVVSDSLC